MSKNSSAASILDAYNRDKLVQNERSINQSAPDWLSYAVHVLQPVCRLKALMSYLPRGQ